MTNPKAKARRMRKRNAEKAAKKIAGKRRVDISTAKANKGGRLDRMFQAVFGKAE